MKLSPSTTYQILLEKGIDFFAGVPDSLLKYFCAYLSDNVSPGNHIISANEGNAIALALGYHLGTGKMPLVYMQNSGIGNAINPLLSLADREIYNIPILMMIGWRGKPGHPDEPQHIKQGRVTTNLLDAMEIPWYELSQDTIDLTSILTSATESARISSAPVAILVHADTFSPYKSTDERQPLFEMNRETALSLIINQLEEKDLIVSTTGKTSRELYELRDTRGENHHQDFLTVGGMGHTSSIALGLARSNPNRRIICIDGDGAALMHLGAFAINGKSNNTNFFHILINNGSHDSVGGQPTVGLEVDMTSIAKAAGYNVVSSSDTQECFRDNLAKMLSLPGPAFLEVIVEKGSRANLKRPDTNPIQNKFLFMNNVSNTSR